MSNWDKNQVHENEVLPPRLKYRHDSSLRKLQLQGQSEGYYNSPAIPSESGFAHNTAQASPSVTLVPNKVPPDLLEEAASVISSSHVLVQEKKSDVQSIVTPEQLCDGLFVSGDVFNNRWNIIEAIGSGGYGVVFKAQDLTNKKEIAIKLIQLDGPETFGVTREAHAFSILDQVHGCPQLIEQFTLSNYAVFVTPLLLKDLTHFKYNSQEQKLSQKTTISICFHTISILENVHAANLVHRDIKAGNIMLKCDYQTNSHPITLIDFGICRDNETDSAFNQNDDMFEGSWNVTPSMNVGNPASRRDDCLMLVYCALYLLDQNPFDASRLEKMIQKKNQFEITPSQFVKEKWIVAFTREIVKCSCSDVPNYNQMKKILMEAVPGFHPETHRFRVTECDPVEFVLDQ